MELKTLKDLIEEQLSVYQKMGEMEARSHLRVCRKRLKQEAIRWFKELKLPEPKRCEKCGMPLNSSSLYIEKGATEFIKHFFNLTEEDLKNENE